MGLVGRFRISLLVVLDLLAVRIVLNEDIDMI